MDALILVLIFGGGLVAGVINTMAGGGSLITLPLLIFAGLPPTVANGTNRVAIVLQNVGALSAFRKQGFTVGGDAATPLKNEYGARLLTPSGDRVPIHPMGRGTISPDISL